MRQAIAGFKPLLAAELLELAGREGVESRFIQDKGGQWVLRHEAAGTPFAASLATPRWTALVQGVDLHHEGVHALMQRFVFVPEARLDDLMISYATNGGGINLADNYDVFLLQAMASGAGASAGKDKTLRSGLPLKILAAFEPEEEHVLEPGDMLYLPPGWAHDGIAVGECMTYSIGFRSPNGASGTRCTARMAEARREEDAIYRDAWQPAIGRARCHSGRAAGRRRRATARAGAAAGARMCAGRGADRAQAECSSTRRGWRDARCLTLDRRTRMMYDDKHVFINGESYRASGRDATLMRRLADERRLEPRDLVRASDEALERHPVFAKPAGPMHADPNQEQATPALPSGRF